MNSCHILEYHQAIKIPDRAKMQSINEALHASIAKHGSSDAIETHLVVLVSCFISIYKLFFFSSAQNKMMKHI